MYDLIDHVRVLTRAICIDQKHSVLLSLTLQDYPWLSFVLLGDLAELVGCQLQLSAETANCGHCSPGFQVF